MRMTDIIEKKKQGAALTNEELSFWVEGVTRNTIPDYQSSALLMAICFRGLTMAETTALTLAMAKSGEQLDLSAFGAYTVDKHSTGGVGDKTTLVVAPIAAAAGCTVAKMSGRGLGHTGGTIDKLDSIPGFRTALSPDEFRGIAQQTGLCVVGQTGNLAPADKKLYALRDVTATVDQTSLIAASIMSKKLAAGNRSIVLDVKTGSGAFMKTLACSRELARAMVNIGRQAGRNMRAVITNMDLPLGYAIGNALEVEEAVATLKGHGPADLTEVCLTLSAVMLEAALGKHATECRKLAEQMLYSGKALRRFEEMVTAQGGDSSVLHQNRRAPFCLDVPSPDSGYVTHIDTALCGHASVLLGAGRETKEEDIDPLAGILLHRKTGDAVRRGEPLCTMYCSVEVRFAEAQNALLQSYTIGAVPREQEPAVYEIIR